MQDVRSHSTCGPHVCFMPHRGCLLWPFSTWMHVHAHVHVLESLTAAIEHVDAPCACLASTDDEVRRRPHEREDGTGDGASEANLLQGATLRPGRAMHMPVHMHMHIIQTGAGSAFNAEGADVSIRCMCVCEAARACARGGDERPAPSTRQRSCRSEPSGAS